MSAPATVLSTAVESLSSDDSDGRREWLLAVLRVARARLQLDVVELDTIASSLKFGVISPEAAVAMLADAGLDEPVLGRWQS